MTDTMTSLPTITGVSDKQIAFAADIRTGKIAWINAMKPIVAAEVARTTTATVAGIVARYVAARIDGAEALVLTETSAPVFIEGQVGNIPTKGGVPADTTRAMREAANQFGYSESRTDRTAALRAGVEHYGGTTVENIADMIIDPAGWGDVHQLLDGYLANDPTGYPAWIRGIIAASR